MNTTSKVLTAVLAGLAAGATLGVLFAPNKGTDTRNLINSEGKKVAENVKMKVREGQLKMDSLKDEINGLKQEFKNTLKTKIDEFA